MIQRDRYMRDKFEQGILGLRGILEENIAARRQTTRLLSFVQRSK